MMDEGASIALFGMGLGSFPRTLLFKDHDAASATFSYAREGGNGFVRLGSGKPLFLGQRVSVVPGKTYTLSLNLRSANPSAAVNVSLCEKSHQQSFRCKEVSFEAKATGTGWQHHEAAFDSGEIGAGPRLLRRPVVLSVANARSGSVVDVDNLRLVNETGEDLVTNGDFSRGGARWFFSADSHLPWHIFNLWVQILFEQGWVGVLAVAVSIALCLTRITVGMWRGDFFSAALLAALCGFLLIGLTESLFDGPRVTTLFFLLLFTGLLRSTRRGAAPNRHIT
jgi:hypothetical protein